MTSFEEMMATTIFLAVKAPIISVVDEAMTSFSEALIKTSSKVMVAKISSWQETEMTTFMAETTMTRFSVVLELTHFKVEMAMISLKVVLIRTSSKEKSDTMNCTEAAEMI